MRLALVMSVALFTFGTSGTAFAGRSFYGWLYGTEVMPERGAELMSWVSEENDVEKEAHLSETRWWIAPAIGINDQLELVLPVQIAWDRAVGAPTRTAFDSYGAELRYRFVTSDPVDAPPLVPLLRVAINRSVVDRDTVIPEANFVVSYTEGVVQVLADVGGYAELSRANSHFEAHPGVGFSVRAIGDVRFGAEMHAELSLDSQGSSWAIAGPNIAWSHGRSWLSAAYGIGFYGIKDAPKVQWGIAF